MSRKTKLTPERQAKIVQAITAGNYLETAARFGGITDRTLHRWMAKGKEEPGSIYGQFCQAVEKARATAEVRNVALIQKAAEAGNWQAAGWWLERSFPKRFGRRLQQEVKVDADIKTEEKPQDRLLRVLDGIAARIGTGEDDKGDDG